MPSVIPALLLAAALQASPEPAPQPDAGAAPVATAPAGEADPIGDLMAAPPEPPPEPPAPPEPVPAPPPAPTPPSPPAPAPAPSPGPEDEDAAENAPALPSAPLPYTSLAPSPPRAGSALFTQPLVRLPPRSQGSLDGGWTLAQANGGQLYSFQFNDLGDGSEVEGAWRDLRRGWSSLGSGPVNSVGYDGSGVTIRFYERGKAQMSVVSLRPAGLGEWSGELQSETGALPVVMKRY